MASGWLVDVSIWFRDLALGTEHMGKQAERVHMKQMLGVGQTTSYESMCWLTGILPARERVWIRAFKFAGRLTSNQVQGVHTSATA